LVPTPSSPDGTTPPPAEAPAARPEGIPDSYWDAEKNSLKVDPVALAKDLKERDELKTFKAAEDVKALSRPQTPEAYKVELPADFKPPAGIEFKFDMNDPLIAQARALAHAEGMSQDAFSKQLGLYAAAKVAEETQIATARSAEIAKLGSTASARVDAVTQWLSGVDTSSDKGDAQALAGMLVTARHVEAFERIINKLTSQGSASFSQSHRVAPDNKPSNEEFSSWSYGEQREYQSSGKRPQRAA
jgi:hypothetical protein